MSEEATRPYTAHEQVSRIEVESDFGGAKSYEWLRGVVLACFNPADEDADEESILEAAVLTATEYVESQPCQCVNTDPAGDRKHPYDDGDQCRRCVVLGRYFDMPMDR